MGKRALVTGASRGISRTVALAGSGARVAVHYQRAAQGAERVVDRITRSGGQGWSVRADPEGPPSSFITRQVIEINGGLWMG